MFLIIITVGALTFGIIGCAYLCCTRAEEKSKQVSIASDSTYLEEKETMLEDSGFV